MKKIIFALGMVALFVAGFYQTAAGAVIQGFQGGIGISTATAGQVGNCPQVTSSSPFLTYALTGNCSGGGSGGIVSSSRPDAQYTQGNVFLVLNSSTAIAFNSFSYSSSTNTITLGTNGSLTGISGQAFAFGNSGSIGLSNNNGTTLGIDTGGNIYLKPVSGSLVFIQDGASNNQAQFYTGLLTTNRTFTFPNASGTFCLTSTCQTVTTTITAQGATITGPAFTIATSGPLNAVTVSGQTVTITSISTSTILSGYATSSNISQGSCTNCNVTFNPNGVATTYANGSAGGNTTYVTSTPGTSGLATSTLNLGSNFTLSSTGTLQSLSVPTFVVSSQFPVKNGNNYPATQITQADTAAIQNGGGVIYLPDASYTVTSTGVGVANAPIKLTSNVQLWCNSNTTINWAAPATSSVLVAMSSTLAVPAVNAGVRDCNFLNTSSTYAGIAIDISNSVYGKFLNNNSSVFFAAMNINDTQNLTFENTVMNLQSTDDNGILSSSTNPVNANTFINITSKPNQSQLATVSNRRYCFRMTSSQSNNLSDLTCEPAVITGAFSTGTVGIWLESANVEDNNVFNSYIEGAATATVMNSALGSGPLNTNFWGGNWNGNGTGGAHNLQDNGSVGTLIQNVDNNFNNGGQIFIIPITASTTYQDSTALGASLLIQNNTNFAHTQGNPLVNIKMLNGTDTDPPLRVTNGGTSSSIQVLNGSGLQAFAVASSGNVTIGRSGANACPIIFMNGSSTKFYLTVASSSGGILVGYGEQVIATSTVPAGC